ncbi:hypothetical protein AB0D11_33005 [Streptomyces monashensis]|uniref:hypothetical protein n=1 Tax=Streptomyces monashensis TaxID=1678012 RepID=UPI0033FCA86B
MPTATAIIDLDSEGPTIRRHLYGHFTEHPGRCVHGGLWAGEDSPVPHEAGVRQWYSSAKQPPGRRRPGMSSARSTSTTSRHP